MASTQKIYTKTEMDAFEAQFFSYMQEEFAKDSAGQDLAHDMQHVLRVVKSAKMLCEQENGNMHVVLPAAYLHDCFSFPKNHPQRSESSTFAAEKALVYLEKIGYNQAYFEDISHAIVAHSFSANIETKTLEAKIVQDADRLDAIGAVGIARCFLTGAKLGRPLYADLDPFCTTRAPDDANYTIDHFYNKLIKLSDTMKTNSAKSEAQKRTQFLHQYLKQLETEI